MESTPEFYTKCEPVLILNECPMDWRPTDDPDCIRGPQPADFPFQVMLGYTRVWITSFSKAKYSGFQPVTQNSVRTLGV